MRRTSPFDVMRLMLRVEMDQARDQLGQARRAEFQAEAAQAAALAAVAAERGEASASDFARWLPAARRQFADAVKSEAAARARLLPALEAVAKAEIAVQVLAAEVATQDLLRRRAHLAKDQRLIEELRPRAISDPES
ncbi:hypothetical protein [Falsiroseomonas sp. E2-1-a20]|uniref:hypothetical protein n=1 Tax=Falsiroseomonas sp. E2-1-a20 TaxID=3239300 RepID=UPI003F3D73CB